MLKDAPEDLDPIVYYLVLTYRYDEPTLEKIIREVRPGEEGKMMSQFAQDIERRVRESALREGMQQGMQQGEHKKAVEMARTLVSKGIATDVISEASGLSEEEIQRLSAIH
uniref:Transposase (putative) YhgA-like domain-containing protein n=1 Tax=Candidatus Kentrum sp. DK TaxID=2126562 RepID=A0A450TNZ6_9GAMM|nr:MAG: conserved hypothetical protein (putative transposase or invertase) [Candidatus Kentron sp. DK]